MRTAGLATHSFDALLSMAPGVASHQDASLDRRRNAQDCLVECLIMARCAGLVSTMSNVSVAAVLFAPEGFRHSLFDVHASAEPTEDELSMC